ncbi:MAG: hypothetical protein IT184_06520 [Acidobacteria bacterium]|nr:hypothetical protein [Acidobacteriota bacterium]
MTIAARLVMVAAACAAISACAKTQARTMPSIALMTPQAPARVAVPVPLPDPDVAPEPPPPAPEPLARPRESQPARTAERPPASTPPPPAAAPAAPAAETPTVLQTTIDSSGLEQRTRTLLDEAQRNLDRVKYKELAAPARAQYDSVASFIRSARQALQIRNYLYAEYLAAKAAAVARELVKG